MRGVDLAETGGRESLSQEMALRGVRERTLGGGSDGEKNTDRENSISRVLR